MAKASFRTYYKMAGLYIDGKRRTGRERSLIVARINDVGPIRIFTASLFSLSLFPARESYCDVTASAITDDVFFCPSRPQQGGLRRTVIVGNDRADLNLSRSPFVIIIGLRR